MNHRHMQGKLTRERLRGHGRMRFAAAVGAKPDRQRKRPPVAVDAFFSRFAQRLGLPGGASVVFGERVEHDGVVVVPVARAVWGMGGGVSGDDDAGGGGGGASVKPLGYIQIAGGAARFHRILTPANVVAVVLAGTAGTAVMLRALGRLLELWRGTRAG